MRGHSRPRISASSRSEIVDRALEARNDLLIHIDLCGACSEEPCPIALELYNGPILTTRRELKQVGIDLEGSQP